MSENRVIVAMSGGVDSSVAAALLVRQDYEVIGVTLNVWPKTDPEDGIERDQACCSLAAADDARRVARKLAIPHYVLNYRELFAEQVIRDFCDEYLRGRTPNPCIRCNRFLKFGALLKLADQLGARHIATGHYARRVYNEASGRWHLLKGLDPGKDQSYVLYVLTQPQLARSLFPLGGLTKEETRRLAGDWGLPVADKPDSQEVCFVPSDNYVEFLEDYVGHTGSPGSIVNRRGEVLGTHRGLARYTVGQRKGLGLARARPLYVLEIDPSSNALIVGEDSELLCSGALAEEANWISVSRPRSGIKVKAKVRYRSDEVAARLFEQNGQVLARFDQPQRAVAPGQAIVFYQEDLVVGGGVICASPPGQGGGRPQALLPV